MPKVHELEKEAAEHIRRAARCLEKTFQDKEIDDWHKGINRGYATVLRRIAETVE